MIPHGETPPSLVMRPLHGLKVAMSVSAGADIDARRLPSLISASEAVAREIASAGATVVYCPRLPLSELSRAVIDGAMEGGEAGRLSLRLVVPEIEYSRRLPTELRDLEDSVGPTGSLRLVTSRGDDFSVEAAPTRTNHGIPISQALTALRSYIARTTNARIAISGKFADDDDEPGIAEECRLTLESGGAVIPIGGFGGVAEVVGRLLSSSDTSATTAINTAPAWMSKIASYAPAHEEGLASGEQTLATSHDPKKLAQTVVARLGAVSGSRVSR